MYFLLQFWLRDDSVDYVRSTSSCFRFYRCIGLGLDEEPHLDHLLRDACYGCESFICPCGVQIWRWTRKAHRSLVCTLRLKDPTAKGTIFQLYAANLHCEAKWLNRFGFSIHASIRSRQVASELVEFLQDNTTPFFPDSSTSGSVFILRDL